MRAVAIFALLALAGCALPTVPGVSYRKVDQETPEFKAAVARETERLRAGGEAMRSAEKKATELVMKRVIETEKEKRTTNVAPLIAALAALEKPRGCWAYTSTTTTTRKGKTIVDIEQFDPFQPESKVWTLVSRDGRVPTGEEQEAYRKTRLRKWKKALARAAERKPAQARVARSALFDDFEATAVDDGQRSSFTFETGKIHLPGTFSAQGMRKAYVVDNARGELVSGREEWPEPVSLTAAVKVDYFHAATDYVMVDPELPPFVAKTVTRHRMHFMGSDTGDVVVETVYAGYRRVKCYDDRFEVHIGAPQLQDLGND